MQLKEIYEKLLRAKRPIDFFDEVTDESELKRVYKDYAKRIHPDKVPLKDRYIANEAFSLLNRLYNLGIEELNKGIYSVIDSVKLYEQIEPLFELNIKGVDYKFYENLYEGEVASGKYYNGPTLQGVNTKYATDKNWANSVYKWMEYLYNRL